MMEKYLIYPLEAIQVVFSKNWQLFLKKKASFKSPDFGRFLTILQGFRLAFLSIFFGYFSLSNWAHYDGKVPYLPSRGFSSGF